MSVRSPTSSLNRAHLCNLDINLSYPQLSNIPTIVLPAELGPQSLLSSQVATATAKRASLRSLLNMGAGSFKASSKRHDSNFNEFVSGQPSTGINSWYGCDLYDEMIDYALNFTFPWCKSDSL